MKRNNNSARAKKDIAVFLVKKNIIIKDAMRKMDKAGEKILFVIDDGMKLLGSLTDGDIRRWILSEGALSEAIGKVFNHHPIFVNEDYNTEEVKEVMIDQKIEWLPVINTQHRIVDILFWEDIFKRKQRDKYNLNIPVVIMAGGEGLRLSPFTKILPKPLIPIGDRPVSKIIMDQFNGHGCKDFYLILCHKAEMVKAYFNNASTGYKINYIEEKNPSGTCGGLRLLPKSFADNFFITNCDTIIKADYKDIYRVHMDNNHDLTLISSIRHLKVPYGVIEIDNKGSLKKIVEKPEYDFLANTGMYILRKSVLRFIPKGKIFHITDLINALKKAGRKIGVYPVSRKSWLDVGQWEEYEKTLTEFDE